jgi:hypothetical protein
MKNNKKIGINLSKKKSNDDEYYTPCYAIEMLKPYLPADKNTIIWECFGRDFSYIESAKTIRSMGYGVIADGDDFWTNNKGDICISNSPYHTPKGERNIKERVIEKLCEANKPFCLLFPTLYYQTKSFKKMVDKYGDFQIILPSTKIQFYKVEDGKKIKPDKGCSFYTSWICWRMNLPSDFIIA